MSDELTIRLSREDVDLLLAAAEWDHANGAAVLRRLPPELAGTMMALRWQEQGDRLGLAIVHLRDQLAGAEPGRNGGSTTPG